jgi:hypothetical protein
MTLRNLLDCWLTARNLLLVGMIVFAAASRAIPHPWNFTAVGAMALFGGATFSSKRAAILVPLVALFAGDLYSGLYNYKLMAVVYASFLLSVCIGFWLRRGRTALRIGAATLASAAQFFVVTNFAVWAFGTTYPKTAAGLAACYVAGIPFFWNTLAGDAFYATLLFGALALAEHRFPALREVAVVPRG